MFICSLRSNAKLGAWRQFTQRRSSFLSRIRLTILYIMTETERRSYWVYLYDILIGTKNKSEELFCQLIWGREIVITFFWLTFKVIKEEGKTFSFILRWNRWRNADKFHIKSSDKSYEKKLWLIPIFICPSHHVGQ